MGVDGDEARRPLILRIAEPVGDAGIGAAEAGRSAKLEADELAILGVVGGAPGHPPFLQLLAIDGIDHPAAARERAEDAELAAREAWQALDGPRLVGGIGVGPERGDPRQHAIADAGGGPLVLLALDHEDAGRGSVLIRPIGRPGDELAIGIPLDDLEHGYRWQYAWPLKLPPGARDQPVIGHVA